MSQQPNNPQGGYEIALQLIAEEAEKKTGILDLGMLGLAELPSELFSLDQLTSLNLGDPFTMGKR